MNEVIDKSATTSDVVLQEIWRAKDRLSSAYGHDLDKLLVLTREREKESGHQIVSFEKASP